MLEEAMRITSGPVALRWPKTVARHVGADAVGRGRNARRVRAGDDVCILAVGKMVEAAEEAAELLDARDVHATVWDVRTIPPDPKMLADARPSPARGHRRGRHRRRRRRRAARGRARRAGDGDRGPPVTSRSARRSRTSRTASPPPCSPTSASTAPASPPPWPKRCGTSNGGRLRLVGRTSRRRRSWAGSARATRRRRRPAAQHLLVERVGQALSTGGDQHRHQPVAEACDAPRDHVALGDGVDHQDPLLLRRRLVVVVGTDVEQIEAQVLVLVVTTEHPHRRATRTRRRPARGHDAGPRT